MKLFNGTIYGVRKFTVALLALVFSFVLALLGKIDSGAWTACAGLVVGLYGAASVGNQVAKSLGNGDG